MSWWTDKLLGRGTVSPQLPPPPMFPQPQPQYQQPAYPQQQQQQQQMPPNGEISAWQATQMWQGGKGVKDAGRCPSCNGTNYFSRAYGENGMPLRNPPAPQCADCGFPLVQFGSPTGQGGDLARTRQNVPIGGAARQTAAEQRAGFRPDKIVGRV